MSMYRLFLFVNVELSHREETSLVFDKNKIHFHYCSIEEKWFLKTKLVSLSSQDKNALQECFLNQRQAKFFSMDSFLEIDTLDGHGIYLKRTASHLERYTIFSRTLKEYLQETSDWKELLS